MNQGRIIVIAGAELIECGVELLRQLLRGRTLFKVDIADILVLASDHLSGSVDAISKMAVAGNYQTDHVRCPPDFLITSACTDTG